MLLIFIMNNKKNTFNYLHSIERDDQLLYKMFTIVSNKETKNNNSS